MDHHGLQDIQFLPNLFHNCLFLKCIGRHIPVNLSCLIWNHKPKDELAVNKSKKINDIWIKQTKTWHGMQLSQMNVKTDKKEVTQNKASDNQEITSSKSTLSG